MPWCRDCGKYKSAKGKGALECGHQYPPAGSVAAKADVPVGIDKDDAKRLASTGDAVLGTDNKNRGQVVLMDEVRAAIERTTREQRCTHVDVIGVLDALKHETEHDAMGDCDEEDDD